jgi:oligopeptide transport system permease protein
MSSSATVQNSEPAAIEKGSSLWTDAFVRLKKNKLAVLGGIIVTVILFLCFIVAPIMSMAGMKANDQDLANRFAGIGEKGVLGTDQLGRDLFMRVLEGGQISLLVAFLATMMTVTIGVIYGGVAGYIGGRIGNIMMRIVDGLLAIVARFLVNEWSWDNDTVTRFANLIPLTIAIAGFGWLSMARIVRSSAASLSKQEFVEAARSLGLSHRRILFRHMLPNMLGPVIIYATLTIPSFILYEATLSFIGLGIEPPNSSWGKLIMEGANFLETNVIVLAIPAVMFSLTLFAFNFLGDGLRDALDPKASKD